MTGDMRRLVGRPVVVRAAGMEYRGTLVELGLRDLVLRTRLGVQQIPWERVGRVFEDRRLNPRR